ncbi:MAG TPA: hypothetical protein VMD78_11435 [Candidatus Baltobacteraceae bacterium]|nr:hypothetical protein [Candidatus Baltobacteraceae bacterium]
MKNIKAMILCACALSFMALATTANAQMGMAMRRPMPSGIFNPTVGAGADYDIQPASGPKTSIEYAIVGKESVDGKDGFWMEWTTNAGPMGEMVMKVLIVPGGGSGQKVIMQMAGRPPMEMPMNPQMGHGNGGSTTPSDIRSLAEDVGTESVTTPAGTFSCEHYRMKDGSGDTWVSAKAAPLGIVKHQGKDSSMVLTKLVTDAKDKIVGTPQPFNPMQMMQQPPQQQ